MWYGFVLDRLQRVTKSTRYLPEVDGLRFFAIFTVILLHLGTHLKRTLEVDFVVAPENTWLNWITSRGGLGVDVFFAISGFILALPFAFHYLRDKDAIALRPYYVRRLTRLEPPYIITLTIFLFVQVLLTDLTWTTALPHYLASFFYLHNIIYDKMSIINPVAWSLEIEVQFYVLAPLFFKLIFSISNTLKRRLTIIGTIVLLVAVNHLFREVIEAVHLRKSLVTALHLFLVGILFADIYVVNYREVDERRYSYWFDLLGIGTVCSLFLLRNTFVLPLDILYTFSIIGLFFGIFSGVVFRWFFRLRVIAVIGGMCYTIYLIHYAFIAFAALYTDAWPVSQYYTINYLFQFLLIIPALLVASAIFFLLFEKPFMQKNWHRRAIQRSRAYFRQPSQDVLESDK